MPARRRLATALVLGALLAPGLLASVVAVGARSDAAPVGSGAAADADALRLRPVDAEIPRRAVLSSAHDFGDAAVAADSEPLLDDVEGVASHFAFLVVRDHEAPAAPDAQPQAATTPGFIVLMATAQESLAALGAAAQTALPQGPSMSQAAPLVWATETLVTPQWSEFGSWSLVAFWSVFLASLGLALLPQSLPAAAWALYARLAKHEVERHPRRAFLLHAIRHNPGVHLEELKRESGLASGVLRHHLDQLRHHGLVRHVRSGRRTHWYASDAVLHAPTSDANRRILQQLRQRPHSRAKDLAGHLFVSVQAVWKQLDGLRRKGLVRSSRIGHTFHWDLCAP